jgi:cystathionine beta-synthase
MLHDSILSAIGNTPLVRVPFDSEGRIYAKLEYLNPSGSVKDRSAFYMIKEAERTGKLKPGGTIIEASSGNQGIAVAMIGAALGYKVIITVFEKISDEKYKTLKAYGAEVIKCPATEFVEDPKSYHSQAVAIQKNTPNSHMLNQYYNPANPAAHYTLLGPEIWQQTEGKITHYFAAAGTCGTVAGAGKYLKEKNPAIKIFAVDSANSFRATKGHPKPYKMEGIGMDFDNGLLDYNLVDEFLEVTDEQGFGILKPTASQYGFLIGLSSGAVAYATQEYAKKHLGPQDLAVMIFGDSGRAYLSKAFEVDTTSDSAQKDPAVFPAQRISQVEL